MSANVENMFYVGDTPWHKEGKPLNEPPDTITAINAAGLNWEVSKVNIFTRCENIIEDYYGIMRNDNKKVLGIVKNNYEPLQNKDAFNFFDPLINNKFLEYETAGSIGEGEIIWILAKIKKNGFFKVRENDVINKYLLLSNSHDGQSAVSVKFTPIRVVCQNTLNIALSAGETTKIKHLKNMLAKLEDIQAVIEDICKIYSNIEGNFNKMAFLKMSEAEAIKYFNNIYPVINKKLVITDNQDAKRKSNLTIRKKLIRNFIEGFGVKKLGISGTLWAAYNAVTEYVDHPDNYKYGDNKLLNRIWFGDGENIKKKAYTEALELIKSA